MVRTYVLAKDYMTALQFRNREIPQSNVEFIPAVESWEINLKQWTHNRVVEPHAVGRYVTRMKHFGLTGRAYQSIFTIACMLTHRRTWELIVAENISISLIFEHDARAMVPTTTLNVQDTIASVNMVDSQWDILNLGRCWDFCSTTKQTNQTNIVTSASPGCSHAYVITLKGAKQLLRYSLPHITSVDFLFSVLYRTNNLQLYSLTPPMWTQYRDIDSHDTRPLVECDAEESKFARYTIDRKGDIELLRIVRAHWISSFISMVSPSSNMTNERCASTCRTISGHVPSTPVIDQVLERLQILNIRCIFIWDDVSNIDVWHIHARLYHTIEYILQRSPVPIRLCQLRGRIFRPCSMLQDDTPNRTLFISSTQFAKNLKLTVHLPIVEGGVYLFHGVVPPRFEHLRRIGRLVQWHVHESRSTAGFLDSQLYALRALHSHPDLIVLDHRHRIYQSPWAALPGIEAIRVRPTLLARVHYTGRVHKNNARVFCRFVIGCHAQNVSVYRTGSTIKTNVPCRKFFTDNVTQRSKYIPLDVVDATVPIIQSDKYLKGSHMHIPVYAFDAFAANLEVVTNNPHIPLMFKRYRSGIRYHNDAAALCRQFVRSQTTSARTRLRLSKFVQNEHTYINRLVGILQLFD